VESHSEGFMKITAELVAESKATLLVSLIRNPALKDRVLKTALFVVLLFMEACVVLYLKSKP
jgi:hypothetical protein